MQSWTPRRPSPGLKAQLFPAAAGSARERQSIFLWAWLAPALAVVCLALFLTGRSGDRLGTLAVAPATNLVLGVAWSNVNFMAGYNGAYHSTHNTFGRPFLNGQIGSLP